MPFQGGRRRTVMVVMVMMTMVMMMVFSGNLDDVSVQLQYSCGRSWQTCGLLDEDIHCGNSAWSQDLGTIDVGCRTSAVQIRLTLYIYNNWLVVWNMFCFPYIGNNNPNWLMFFRGVETTNQIYMYIYVYIYISNNEGIISEACDLFAQPTQVAASGVSASYLLVDRRHLPAI